MTTRAVARIATAVAGIVALIVAVHADAPVSVADSFEVFGNRNDDHLIQLRTNVRIPDLGELNWPLYVPDDFVVHDVKLTLTGLYHPHTEDLTVQLRHRDRVVDVTRGCAVDFDLGQPDPFPHPNDAGPLFPPSTGAGFQYVFEDALGTNLALGRPTNQSSTQFGGSSDLAVDGNIDGFFSSGSVTHTGGTLEELQPDPQPWWYVDLETEQIVGSVRVWNRQNENDIDEVQVVTTAAVGQLAGSFRLSFSHHNQVARTTDIAWNAVGAIRDEDPASSAAGVGAGESVQAKLQALENIGQVKVTRGSASSIGAYSWTVVFLSEPGNLDQMSVYWNNITSPAGQVTVRTPIEGSASVWEGEDGKTVAVSGRLVPAYVMLLPDGTDMTASLSELVPNATWSKLMTVDQRQTLFRLPTNTSGRYIRVQLTSTDPNDYLSLAEVQAYRKEAYSFCTYRGGTPIPKGRYHGTQSLMEGFFGVASEGEWILTIDDVAQVAVSEVNTSRPEFNTHGYGGLQWWTLDLINPHGETRRYHADVTFEINTLPVFGKLYSWNATDAVLEGGFTIVEGRGKYLSDCYNNCNARFGVGNAMSTSPDGSVTVINRVTAEHNARSVLYVPERGYLGKDHFTYTAFVGVSPSANRGTVTVHTRKCRLDCSNEQFDDLLLVTTTC